MKSLPITNNTLLLRTDFSDDVAWAGICAEIGTPVGEFRAYVDIVSDPEFEAVPVEALVAMTGRDESRTFLLIVDHVAIAHRERPILVVDLYDEPGRTFRVIPRVLWSVENNLSISNMDFEEFVAAVDDDGVLRDM